jgi:hypothetical protein
MSNVKKLALTICLAVLLCARTSTPGMSQMHAYTERLIGNWSLVSVQLSLRDGKIERPYGPNAKGILTLERNGRFVFVTVNPDTPRPRYSGSPTPDEGLAIARGSLSSFGTYLADEKRTLMTFTVEASSDPSLKGYQHYEIVNLTESELGIYLIPPPGGRELMQYAYKRSSAAAPTKVD